MQIKSIRVRNVMGSRDIDAQLGPVNLFAGFNAAGKSSIQEAVRMALQGETVRVKLKKDLVLMVTDGAKEGFVKLVADDKPYEYRLPAGEHTAPDGWESNPQLQCVLDAQRFTDMSDDDRRAFLTILTKAKPNKEKIKELMLEGGIDEHRIELAIPMLTSGFPAANTIALQKATEAKGAWKGVTGGTWGSKKGEDWQAPEVDAPEQSAIDAAAALVTEKETGLADLQQQLGATVEKVNKFNEQSAQVEAAKAKVAQLARLREKLLRDEESLAGYEAEHTRQAQLAGAAPRDGLVHDLAAFVNVVTVASEKQAAQRDALLEQYVAAHGPINAAGDPEARAKLPALQKSIDLMKNCVANDKRDIAAGEQAEANLKVLGGLEEITAGLIDQVKADVAALAKELADARKDFAGLQKLKLDAEQRDARTADAKKHHVDIVGWLKVADQFAPDGLPSQILAKALAPINKLLREYATNTEWFQVAIRPDMAITANSRPLTLLSEAERWMVNAHITVAIAELSGIKLVVLDRFDVLDVRHRPELLMWLDDLAADQRIDTSLVFGTLKEQPKGLPDSISSFWITEGELATALTLAHAA